MTSWCSTSTAPCCSAWGSSLIRFPPVAYADCHGYCNALFLASMEGSKRSTQRVQQYFCIFLPFSLHLSITNFCLNDTNVVKTQIPSSSLRNHSLFLYLPPFQIYPGASQSHPLWDSSKPTDATCVCLVCLAVPTKYILGLSVICERIVNYVCVGLWTENLVGSRDHQNIERVLENALGKIYEESMGQDEKSYVH